MNKKELYNKILQLNGLTNEEKSELLGLLRKQKKYGLLWEDKPEDVEERLREELPVLIEDTSKAIISEDADAPNHILIEDDNLEALTALAYTHEGKIDVIFIDPPYNTGNKDFVYNDSFVDKGDRYRHSKWLSFMNKRLRIAKQLLSDRGVIFISIDDNEQAQLKLLCDEVFGERHFVGLISRATGTTTGQDTDSLGKACDYMLAYSRRENFIIGGLPLDEKDLERHAMADEKGKFSILQLRRTGGEDRREDRPTMFFPITAPEDTEIFEEEDKADLIGDCYIIKMDGYPKDGPIAKAIVYFLISKLNNINEQLEKQATNDEVVQIRHFSIIDEAHYMLDFDNRPLRNLIAVGRNKGLSIILATQNMSSFKSKGFDFYANDQYPLIMKQQTIDDKVIKDLFGVSGNELQEIRTAIAGLQKGELIIKDQMVFALGMGKKYKKIYVTHLI